MTKPGAIPAEWGHEYDDYPFKVLINDEEQYSIWLAEREAPPGWRDEGTTGTKQECLDHIADVWTDMRPLSLRRQMEEQERAGPPPEGG